MTTKIRRHHYCYVERSPYIQKLNDLRERLEAANYAPVIYRQHVIRLDQTLREMAKAPGATYTTSQLSAAFGKPNASPAQLGFFRATQRHYQAYLASQGRLTIPVVVDRFADLRDRYHRELVEVRGFAHSTLRQHDSTAADFLSRGLAPRQSLHALTQDDIGHYIALKSRVNSRQSLQNVVAALRSLHAPAHMSQRLPYRTRRQAHIKARFDQCRDTR